MRDLAAGERTDVTPGSHDLRVSARNADFLANAIGAVLLPLGGDGKTLSGCPPLIAGEQTSAPGLAFRIGHGFDIDLASLPAEVERVAILLYVIGGRSTGTSLADLNTLTLEIDGDMRFGVDLRQRMESAIILAEFYRRGTGWRVAANGQGFTGGIAAINQALGIALVVPDSEAAMPARGRDDWRRESERPPAGATSGGSGFAVAPRLVITNYHVIEHASVIAAAGEHRAGPATIVATDPRNDIALLQLDHDANAVGRFRVGDIDLGEDVIVGGFPLQGLLGTGPQISGGNISSLTGMHNDSSIVTFNAPIGSGNSGGPILDSAGLVVGLVCSVLRSDIGHDTIVQNVNFGVKSALVRSFLHAAGLAPEVAASASPRGRADVAREARGFLYRINVTY